LLHQLITVIGNVNLDRLAYLDKIVIFPKNFLPFGISLHFRPFYRTSLFYGQIIKQQVGEINHLRRFFRHDASLMMS